MSGRFENDMHYECDRAESLHAPMHSLHEGYAVILEELDEAWDEIKRKECDALNVYRELVQVAAMCMRLADNCGLTAAMEYDIHRARGEETTS